MQFPGLPEKSKIPCGKSTPSAFPESAATLLPVPVSRLSNAASAKDKKSALIDFRRRSVTSAFSSARNKRRLCFTGTGIHHCLCRRIGGGMEITMHKSPRGNPAPFYMANKMMRSALKKYAPLFLLPTVAAFAIGFVWPFLWGIDLSFFSFTTLRFRKFVGFSNYIRVFTDPYYSGDFLHALGFTAVFALVSVILINVLAFLIAYALTKNIRGSTVFRTVFFMPNLIGGIVLGYIWKIILNDVIRVLYHSQLVLETKYGFWGLIILMCWQQIGYMMIIYIAGLQNIPTTYVEAARIDGASSRQILTKITIPCVMPSITICTFLSLTNAFKLYDQNLALTGGDPAKTTQMLALNITKAMYSNGANKGIGQAEGVIFFLIVVTIALIQLRMTRKGESAL